MNKDRNKKIRESDMPGINLNTLELLAKAGSEIGLRKFVKQLNGIKEMEKIIKKFNDEEMGGGYLYFLHQDEFIQMDLVDYSTCVVCGIEDIKSIQFVQEEGVYIELKENICEMVDSIWIDKMGVQM